MAGPEQESRQLGHVVTNPGYAVRSDSSAERAPGFVGCPAVGWPGGSALPSFGLIVVAAGIILLPLPGPGWVIIFTGIAIWATEFEWAERLLMWTKRQVAEYTVRIRAWWRRRNRAGM